MRACLRRCVCLSMSAESRFMCGVKVFQRLAVLTCKWCQTPLKIKTTYTSKSRTPKTPLSRSSLELKKDRCGLLLLLLSSFLFSHPQDPRLYLYTPRQPCLHLGKAPIHQQEPASKGTICQDKGMAHHHHAMDFLIHQRSRTPHTH